MDEHAEKLIRIRRDGAAQDASALRAVVADPEKEPWQWDLGKLLRKLTEEQLLTFALTRGAEVAVDRAVELVLSAADITGSTDLFARATRDAKAEAAKNVLDLLPIAGVSTEYVGKRFLREQD